MSNKVLLTGVSGYIGGQLLDKLLEKGISVRCLVRRPSAYLEGKDIEIAQGDVLDKEALKGALTGIHTAYYLIHSLGTSLSKFEAQDRKAAEQFALIAKKCGVSKIIYLGGLGSEKKHSLSPHLRSRQEVGHLLRKSDACVIEFRASIILGSGSASYEILRALVCKLPFMIAPRWVKSLCQPLFVEDVLRYLIEALDARVSKSEIIEIGGPEQIRYVDLLKEYAHQTNRTCHILILPILTPRLSSLWLGLVTPVYARIGRALIESVKNDTVLENTNAKTLFPFEPIGYKEALKKCILLEDKKTRSWMSAFSSKGYSIKRLTEGKRIRNCKWEGSITINKSREEVFALLLEKKNFHDWVYAQWLWNIRGFLDSLFGGVGFRKSIQQEGPAQVGDILNFWRFEKIEKDSVITLMAEMNMPGIAHFSFLFKDAAFNASQQPSTHKVTELFLLAEFKAAGFLGLCYWMLTYPIHFFLFPGTLKKLKRKIESS